MYSDEAKRSMLTVEQREIRAGNYSFSFFYNRMYGGTFQWERDLVDKTHAHHTHTKIILPCCANGWISSRYLKYAPDIATIEVQSSRIVTQLAEEAKKRNRQVFLWRPCPSKIGANPVKMEDIVTFSTKPKKSSFTKVIHYNQHPSGIECIDVAKHHSFNIGSVLKYIWRCGIKDGSTKLEDLKKARAYIDYAIEDEKKRLAE